MRISDWSSDVCSSDLRAFDRIMLRMERGEAQQGEAGERGDERPHQDADLRFLDEQRVAREGEPADEQAHREADPAQHRDAIDLEPGRPAQPARDAEFDREPYAAENADMLAEDQHGGDAQRQRREQLIGPYPPDTDPRRDDKNK